MAATNALVRNIEVLQDPALNSQPPMMPQRV